MLEVHEHIPAPAGLAGDRFGPTCDVVGRIAFVTQSEVGVVGRDPNRRRQLLAVRNAKGKISRRRAARITSSSSHDGWRNSNAPRTFGGSSARNASNSGRSFLAFGGKLEEQGAELVAERAGDCTESSGELATVPKTAVVGDSTWGFQRQLVWRRRWSAQPFTSFSFGIR